MRFKPRCFDYHTEATNLLREGHQKKQTRKIRISTSAIDIESSNEKENDSSISMEETSPLGSSLPVCSGRNIFAGSPRVGLVAKGVAVVVSISKTWTISFRNKILIHISSFTNPLSLNYLE